MSATVRNRRRTIIGLVSILTVLPGSFLWATSVIPIRDAELAQRADVVVRGIVITSDVVADPSDRPETVTVIEPLEIWKGSVAGDLVLHQPGGMLPDGRFLQLWGRPEYVPGREVVVFAIARPEGDFQTAEMLLGKFEVESDEAGNRFAIPDLAAGVHPGVDVVSERDAFGRSVESRGERTARAADPDSADGGARSLSTFAAAIRTGAWPRSILAVPQGRLEPVVHSYDRRGRAISGAVPQWGNISNQLWRWNNNATAAWTLVNQANMTGGGTAEATGALASWTNDPNSNVNYTVGSGSGDTVDLNATSSSGCGWSTCLSGAGVIGCGGPSGGGSNAWRGDSYITITQGFVQLRSFCTTNAFDSVTVQSVLTHELGHTLGLGHSDQNASPYDVCRGDEDAAIMRSVVQNRTTLGTDDQDAIRWLYGDGGNSCSGAPSPSVSGVTPTTGLVGGGTAITVTGANFQAGATLTLGGVAVAAISVVNSTTIYATTAAHSAGAVNVVVTNPDSQAGTSVSAFTFVPIPATSTDIDGNGSTDLIWRNQTTGQNSVWLMNGTTPGSVVALPTVGDTNWRLVGAGDFNRDGKTDLVWRNGVTGANVVWLMNATTVLSVVSLPTVSDVNWNIVGVADFNGDGNADLVWRNGANGIDAVWLMNGTTVSSIVSLPTVRDLNWKIAGVGDFNNDGKPDLVWRNSVNGLNSVWLMNGTTLSTIAGLPTVSDLTWQIVGVGDFNGDKNADLVWRNSSSGLNALWVMSGTSASSVVSLPTLSDPAWRVGAPR